MKLNEIREKYPEYDILSDQELADRLHAKFYPDLDKNDFYNRINFKPISKKGMEGIFEDIKSGVKQVPSALKSMVSELPSEIYGAATHPNRIPQNLLAGLAQGGAGLLNTPANIRDYLVEKDLASQESPSFRLPQSILPQQFDYAKGLGLGAQAPGDALIQSLGAAAPYIAGGEAGTLGTAARMGARAGTQAAFATGQNENPITAGLMVPAIELPLRGAPALYEAARPTNLFRGNLSTEELAANLRAAQGTNTDLGNIIGSPTLKQIFENLSTKWPGSGADELLGRMANQVENKGQDLLKTSGKDIPPGDRNRILKDTIEQAYENQRKIKDELYHPVDEAALSEGFKLELPSLEKFSKEFGATINKSALMKNDPALKSIFNDLSKYKTATKQTQHKTIGPNALLSEPEIIYPSLVEAKSLANRLQNEATSHYKSSNPADHFIAGKYQKAANAIRDDIKNQISTKGSDNLKELYKKAEKNYAENYSQFLDKDIYKWTRPDVNAETIINDIIQPGKQNDKFTRIEKIQNILPENMKNIFGDAWLRNAIDKEGQLNPKQLSQMINKLGPRQFEALFPDPQFRQQLLDYGRLRGMNEKALSRMANPMTGASLGAPGMIGAQIAGVVDALNQGNYPLAAIYALGPQIGSNLINKLLTNPATRERFIYQMLENETRPPRMPSRINAVPFLAAQNNEQ